jgi:hypothetical protein
VRSQLGNPRAAVGFLEQQLSIEQRHYDVVMTVAVPPGLGPGRETIFDHPYVRLIDPDCHYGFCALCHGLLPNQRPQE